MPDIDIIVTIGHVVFSRWSLVMKVKIFFFFRERAAFHGKVFFSCMSINKNMTSNKLLAYGSESMTYTFLYDKVYNFISSQSLESFSKSSCESWCEPLKHWLKINPSTKLMYFIFPLIGTLVITIKPWSSWWLWVDLWIFICHFLKVLRHWDLYAFVWLCLVYLLRSFAIRSSWCSHENFVNICYLFLKGIIRRPGSWIYMRIIRSCNCCHGLHRWLFLSFISLLFSILCGKSRNRLKRVWIPSFGSVFSRSICLGKGQMI